MIFGSFRPMLTAEGLKTALTWLNGLFAIVVSAVNVLVIGHLFCGLDRKKIEAKIRNKVEMKYSYLKN